MKKKILNWIFKSHIDDVYDFVVSQFIGDIPADVREPALDFLADRRVLFEKFLTIQAYNMQRQRVMSKKGQDFFDGALVVIRAFLVAVNKKIQARTTIVPEADVQKEVDDELKNVGDFIKAGQELNKK